MSVGVSALLVIVGAILRFAVSWSGSYVDLKVVGVIFMIGGAVGLVASIVVALMRRRNQRAAEVYEERHYIEPPP
ncbi:DUF6458 family protein [Trebonia sp.]|uniref:DUF6458 family protein n=1 Tax=Trebonia sp. TaxID=2767075 RepID=UPI002627D79C|nr:DUF6458 family protein [Trebonia sp.]